MIKIDKGIPMPPPKNKKGLVQIFREMEIGDSVLLNKKSAYNMSSNAAKNGMKVRQQKQPDGQYRVWKVGVTE